MATSWVFSRIIRAKSITNHAFGKHLLLTNLGISMSLSAVGDYLQQHYEIIKTPDRAYNWERTRNMTGAGLTLGYICHHWYRFLDHRLPGRSFKIVMKKLFLDQIIFSPICISVFFLTVAAIEGSTLSKLKGELKEKSWRLYLAEWIIWPPAQLINFFILPTRYRVLYDNTISLGYDVYTSYIYNEIPVPAPKEKDQIPIINHQIQIDSKISNASTNIESLSL